MTKEERLKKARAKILWCVHVLGPDEMIAKESYEAAEKHATELSDFMHGPHVPDLNVLCLPIVAVWPYGEQAHRDELAKAKAADCAGSATEGGAP
ncbi:MAG TPA: hypothetical protein VM430_08290 [Microbacterium sp.]|jgi:hypothetical protein|nr:hypothetical protein [Microbacterium sp.]